MNESEFRFLSIDDVLVLHELQIERYGGSSGIRDRGLLESAVAMPQASFGGAYMHTVLFEMAAAYTLFILRKISHSLTVTRERLWLPRSYF